MTRRSVVYVAFILCVLLLPSAASGATLFTTQTPALTNVRDGVNVNYELGMAFTSTAAGQITGIRFWKASSETGTHTGRIWSGSGQMLASVTFTGETGSGWQQQNLATPLSIAANTNYVVTVNTGNAYYVATNNGLASQIVSGNLRSVVGNNGLYGSPGAFPTNTWQSSNYFRDVVFVAGATTYSMTGTVNPVPAGGSVTMNVTGAGTATTTTNSAGVYTVSGLANGNYTVTPSKSGATFTPSSRAVTINGGNVTGQDFTVQTYSISGIVSEGGGATVALSGAAGATVTADAAGTYVFSGLLNGNYTVTPSKSGSTFSPPNQAVAVSGANVPNINFVAVYSISGTITGGGGATLTLSGGASATTTANGSGNYTFSGLNNGSYTIAATKAGATFNPASQVVPVNGANVTSVNFAVVTYSISGTITGGGASTVTLSGASSATVTADASGNYTFSGLLNGSYTVTPSKSGSTFSPPNQPLTVSGADVPNINFVAVYSISGTITGGNGATVTLVNSSTNVTATANSSGNYTFSGLSNGTYTVTPTKAGFTFTPASQDATISGAGVTGLNFGVVTYSISGTITGPAGATVTLSGPSSATTTSDASGNYTFSGLYNGIYTVTPGETGFTFNPIDQSVTISDRSASAINFSAPTYSISGTVSAGSGTILTLSGASSATATADSSGNYTFTGLGNGTYTVTPSKSGFSFAPLNQTVTISSASLIAVNFTATVSVTLAIDATAFGDGKTSATSVTTSAFSTTTSSELLLAMVGADVSTSSGTNNSVTSVSGGGLTWVLVRRNNTQRGTAEIWRAFAPTPLSNVTVTANLAISAVSSITVMSFRGVNTSGTNGSGAIGNTGAGNGSTGSPTASLITLGNNSLVLGVGEDWNAAPSVTAGANQTRIHQLALANLNTFWTQRQNATTPASGTTVTINDTVPTNHMYNLTICEILAGSGGTTPAPSITAIGGTPQIAAVTTSFGTNLQAKVLDASNNPVVGTTVTFTVPGSGATGSFASGANSAITNSSGMATAAAFTANTTAGSYTVTASASGVTSPASFLLTNAPGPAASVTATTGTPQSATINTAFATNLQLTVKDVYGNAVSGATVAFTAPASGASGTFAGGGITANATTNSNGIATAPTLTANAIVGGPYNVAATVSGVGTPANFALTNVSSGALLLYPDLQDILPTGSMSVVTTSTGRQFQYTHDTLDAGPGPLVIKPVFNTASGNYQGTQYIYTQSASGTWTISKQLPVAGAFFFDSDHGHFHFPFVTYGLYADANGTPGAPVAVTAKVSFCINDSFIYLPNIPNAGAIGNLGSCADPTSLRGLNIGAVDEYDHTDPGQSIEIDGLPDGTYWLRAIVDPNNFLAESNKTNNETDVKFTITGTTLQVLQSVVPVINAPPAITLTSPASGAIVSGTIPLNASSLTSSGAQFLIDGESLGSVISTGSYTAAWDTTTVPNGTHWLAAQTTDSSGVIGTSAVTMVTVSNGASPATTVHVTSPTTGSILSATVSLYATVATSQTIASVAFYIDSTQVGAPVTSAPYMILWDTTTVGLGPHVLTASATDTLGNVVSSVPITVTVDNTHAAKLITKDVTVFQDGQNEITTPLFSTAGPGELLVAFVSYAGPSNAAQTASVAGAGLSWTLLERSNTQHGTAEIWAARAAIRLPGTFITSVPGVSGYDGSLTVVAFINAAGTSVVGRTGAPTGQPDIPLPGVVAGDWVFAVGNDWSNASPRAPVTGQVLVHQDLDTTAGNTYWVQSTTAPTAANGLVDIHDSSPTGDMWNYAAVEIVAAHQ